GRDPLQVIRAVCIVLVYLVIIGIAGIQFFPAVQGGNAGSGAERIPGNFQVNGGFSVSVFRPELSDIGAGNQQIQLAFVIAEFCQVCRVFSWDNGMVGTYVFGVERSALNCRISRLCRFSQNRGSLSNSSQNSRGVVVMLVRQIFAITAVISN